MLVSPLHASIIHPSNPPLSQAEESPWCRINHPACAETVNPHLTLLLAREGMDDLEGVGIQPECILGGQKVAL